MRRGYQHGVIDAWTSAIVATAVAEGFRLGGWAVGPLVPAYAALAASILTVALLVLLPDEGSEG